MSDDENANSLAVIGNSLSAILSQMEAIPKLNTAEEYILRQLYFSSMYSRLDTVSEAEMGTFAWLLEDRPEELHLVKSGLTEITTRTSDSSLRIQSEKNEQDTAAKRDEQYDENTNGSEVNHSTNGSSKLSDEQKSKNHVRQSFLE